MIKRLQIMKNRPHVTDEEIRSYMNFDSVVSQHQAHKKATQTWLRNAALILGVVGIGIAVYFTWPVHSNSTATGLPVKEPQSSQVDSVGVPREITLAETPKENEAEVAKEAGNPEPAKTEKKSGPAKSGAGNQGARCAHLSVYGSRAGSGVP